MKKVIGIALVFFLILLVKIFFLTPNSNRAVQGVIASSYANQTASRTKRPSSFLPPSLNSLPAIAGILLKTVNRMRVADIL